MIQLTDFKKSIGLLLIFLKNEQLEELRFLVTGFFVDDIF